MGGALGLESNDASVTAASRRPMLNNAGNSQGHRATTRLQTMVITRTPTKQLMVAVSSRIA